MTLILAMANSDQIIQVSDRRITMGGTIVDEESNKTGVLLLPNARFVFGFTGLASTEGFQTRQWLLDSLLNCAPPEYSPLQTLERLKDVASKDFQTLPPIKHLSARDKRLSIMFTGYLPNDNPPLVGNAILTNYQDFDTGKDDVNAWDNFTVGYWTEKCPLKRKLTFVQRAGTYTAMNRSDEKALRKMLKKLKPTYAIVEKAVELIREMADRPVAKGTIGKQLSVVILRRHAGWMVETAYYSDIVSYNQFAPDYVFALGDGKNYVLRDFKIWGGDQSGPKIMAVPKVRKNAPCPCGSGVKYKRCHKR